MSENLFWLRANSLKLRYRRSLLNAQRRHVKALKDLGMPIPQRLAHLEGMRHG